MATNAIAISGPQQVSRYDQKEVIDTIKQTVCRGATDPQLRMFLEVCKRTGLDPFLKEIWFVAEKSIIMAGRDGYLRVANEHPQFDGIETRVDRDEKMVPIKAVCTVWRKDRTHPTICEAYYNEYKSGSPVWTKYPSAMISKVAEVLALKRSFAINGVVSEEEMGAEYAAPQLTPQQVAQQKIAQMQAGKAYAEISTPDPRKEEPSQEEMSALDKAMLSFTSKANIKQAFADLKPHFLKLLDADVWDQICKENGVDETAGSFGTIGNAKKGFKALWTAAEKAMSEIPAEEELVAQ